MEPSHPNKIIWSLSTRILHWCVAIPTLVNYLLDGGESPHEWVGYVAAAFVVLRLVWGLISSDHAHFRHFPLHPRAVVEHLHHINQRHQPARGHNPLASWVYLLMWAALLALAVTGFMMGTDAYWGEEWLEELHDNIATGLQVLIGLHFLGIAYDCWRFKRSTWRAKVGFMYREEPDNEFDSGWRFMAGDEDDEFVDNPDNCEVYDVNTIANYDPSIIAFMKAPIGSAFERTEGADEFQEIEISEDE